MTLEEYKAIIELNKKTRKQMREMISKSKLSAKDKKVLRWYFNNGLLLGQSMEKAKNDIYLMNLGKTLETIMKETCEAGGIPVPLDIFKKISLSTEDLKNAKMVVKK